MKNLANYLDEYIDDEAVYETIEKFNKKHMYDGEEIKSPNKHKNKRKRK